MIPQNRNFSSYQKSKDQQNSFVPNVILFAAVFFNAVLAVINSQLYPEKSIHVVASEILIYFFAVGFIFYRRHSIDRRWILLGAIILVNFILKSIATLSFSPKDLRDMILIPVFVLLGQLCSQRSVEKSVAVLCVIVVVIGLYEAVFLSSFESIMNIKSYYINTRGFVEEDFWTENSLLFVNAYGRGEVRFFPLWDLHRVSSIFLEPVSLGNFSAIIALYLYSNWSNFKTRSLIILSLSTLISLVLSDSRFSSVAILGSIILSVGFRHVLRPAMFWLIPVICITAIVIVVDFGDFKSGPDTFTGRLAGNAELLTSFDLLDLLGASSDKLSSAVDSGISYSIISQSLFGLLLIFTTISIISETSNLHQIKYHSCLWCYLSLNMMISYSFLSIKTAAILWFIHGSMLRQTNLAIDNRHTSKNLAV